MRFMNNEHKLYVTGDTHGEDARFVYEGFGYNRDLKEGDILFVCGDFGFIGDDSYHERTYLNYLANEKEYTICFVDGNHENFDLINSFPVSEWNGGMVHIIRKNRKGIPKIIHLMRGQGYTIYGKKIFTFGGAYSIDKYMRTPGISWWEQEMPTDEEMQEGNSNLERHGYKVDYILTHTAPEETMYRYHPNHEHEVRLNNYLEHVREDTEYKHWYFGHLHRDEDTWRNQTVLWFDVIDMLTGEIVPEDKL